MAALTGEVCESYTPEHLRQHLEPMLSFVARGFLREQENFGGGARHSGNGEGLPPLLDSFPRLMLVDGDESDFLRQYQQVLVPLCLWHDPSPAAARRLATRLSVSEKEMVLGTFPQILSYCLPHLTAADGDRGDLLKQAHGDEEKVKREGS